MEILNPIIYGESQISNKTKVEPYLSIKQTPPVLLICLTSICSKDDWLSYRDDHSVRFKKKFSIVHKNIIL